MLTETALALAALPALPALGFLRAAAASARVIREEVLAPASPVTLDVSPEALAGLPAPVRRYLGFACNGRRAVTLRAASWRESGRFSLPIGRFETRARQVSRAAAPVFAWSGVFRRGPVPVLESRDALLDGRHEMGARLGGWLPVMRADYTRPEEIASLRSNLTLRYFGQAPLMPWALLPSPHIAWEAGDSHSARLRLTGAGLAAGYEVRFGEDGRIEEMRSDRLLLEGNGVWQAEAGRKLDYREVGGFRVPTRLDYLWTLADGAVAARYAFTVEDLALIA
jgi:hypothetical protein